MANDAMNIAHSNQSGAQDAGNLARDAASGHLGSSDPGSQSGRLAQLNLNEKDQIAGQASSASTNVDVVRGTVADPHGAATSGVTNAGMHAAADHVPAEAQDVSGRANQARSAVQNPESAAEGEVRGRIDGQGAEASVGVSASVSTDPKKP